MEPPPLAPAAPEGRAVLARLDRLPAWPLPWTHLALLGIASLSTFYNLSAGPLAPALGARFGMGRTESLMVAVVAGLCGYLVGSIAGGVLAERRGRVPLLGWALAIAALGSLATALSSGPLPLAGSRFVAAAGLGAAVNMISVYVTEVSPAARRGRAGGITFVIGILGQSLAVVLALVLEARVPAGGRWLFAAGCLIAVPAFLVRRLPESPRWLVQRERLEPAAQVLERMEQVARARGLDLPEPDPSLTDEEAGAGIRFDALRHAPHEQRLYLLLAMWGVWYLGAYGLLGAGPALLGAAAPGAPARIAFAVAAAAGFPIGAAVMAVIGDRVERKLPTLSATAVWLVGLAVAAPLRAPLLVALGLFVACIGFGLYLPLAFTYTAENLPTRARAVGFGLAEGGGHLGGVVGALALPAVVAATSRQFGLVAIGVLGLAAGILALAGPKTRGRSLAT